MATPCALGTPPLLRMGPLARRGPRRRGREPSFGMGVLEVKSATEAEWVWHRNQRDLPPGRPGLRRPPRPAARPGLGRIPHSVPLYRKPVWQSEDSTINAIFACGLGASAHLSTLQTST